MEKKLAFLACKRLAKTINKLKKRIAVNKEMERIEQALKDGNIKQHHNNINKVSKEPQIKMTMIKDTDGIIRTEKQEVLER